jgi:hypothetical protein
LEELGLVAKPKMNTYLLTWNPKKSEWDLAADAATRKAKGYVDINWSCGRTKRIEPGDRVFLLNQGREPRGIMASGHAKSSPKLGSHWDKSRKGKALYVSVRFDVLLIPEEEGVLRVSQFQNGPLGAVNWSTQMSGISIEPAAASQLEKLWSTFSRTRGSSVAITHGAKTNGATDKKNRGAIKLSDSCVYTIATMEHVSSAVDTGKLHEGKRWTKALELLHAARKADRELPVLIADATHVNTIIAWSVLRSISITDKGTDYTIGELQYFPPIPRRALGLRVLSTGKRLPPTHQRSYVLCRTPEILHEQANNPIAWSERKLRLAQRSEKSPEVAALPINKQTELGNIRRSPAAASQIIRQLVRPEHLHDIVKALAQSVLTAHSASPSKWGLRLKHDSIMLKVGFVEVLTLHNATFHFLVHGDVVPKKQRNDSRLKFRAPPYRNAPGCESCDMDCGTAIKVYPSLCASHEAAIRVAAKSPRRMDTTKDHSPGLIVFLSSEFGALLPQPAYLKDQSENVPTFPDEIPPDEEFQEGAAIQVLVNRYERRSAARDCCLAHYGARCHACDRTMAEQYGSEVGELIHVHHLTPLASVGGPSSVDGVRDLRPVCPNCHAVIHSKRPPYSVEEVKVMLRKQRAAQR